MAGARETVTIVYSWNVGDAAMNFYRALAEESNKIQNKYQFIVEAKPGAGGSIAAKHVESNPSVILANSSALFIRPIFFPGDQSHNVSAFKSILPMCSAPMLIVSSRYKNWNEVPKDRQLTIGMSGNGSTTHLVATQVAARYPNMITVPFKSTSDALLSAVSEQTDFAVVFMGDAEGWTKDNRSEKKVHLLGTTGRQAVGGAAPLSTQGFPATLADMSSNQQIFVNKQFPDAKFREIRGIFFQAARGDLVRRANAVDHCIPNSQVPDGELDAWFRNQEQQWTRIATPVAEKLKTANK